jgi:hypothetical protein
LVEFGGFSETRFSAKTHSQMPEARSKVNPNRQLTVTDTNV